MRSNNGNDIFKLFHDLWPYLLQTDAMESRDVATYAREHEKHLNGK
jgi:hypothetical protein